MFYINFQDNNELMQKSQHVNVRCISQGSIKEIDCHFVTHLLGYMCIN